MERSLFAEDGAPADGGALTPVRRYPIGPAVCLLVLQAVLSWAAFYWFVLQALSIAGCGDQCDYALAGASNALQVWGSVALLAAAVLTTIMLWIGRKPTWWAPAAGMVAVVLLTVGTTVAMHAATSVS